MAKLSNRQYEDIKDKVRIEGNNPLRQLSDQERSNLIKSLLQDGALTNAITVVGNDTEGFVIKNGRHRWSVLPEVYELYPDFSPVIRLLILDPFKNENEERKYAIQNQLGQRNLSKEEIVEYVNILMEEGVSKNQAMKEVAQQTGFSKSTIERTLSPQLLENQKQKYKENKQTLSKSVDEEPLKEVFAYGEPVEEELPEQSTINEIQEEETVSMISFQEQHLKLEKEALEYNYSETLKAEGLSEEERDILIQAADGIPTLAILPKHEALFKHCSKEGGFPHVVLNESCKSTFAAPNYTKISDEQPYGDYESQEELFDLYKDYYTRHRIGLGLKATEQLVNKLLFAKWGDSDSLVEDCPYSVLLSLINS